MTTTRRVIAALQGLGCQVALDDVGTGHSGLSSILRLGVDVIKIDKIFIDSLGSERNSAAIVATLVELARNMGMEVVAEGVESFEQVEDLRARGIRAAQGYVFAPPLPASSFLTLLDALNPATAASGTQQGTRGGRVASTGLDLGGLRLADTKPAQAKESPGPDRDYSAASDDLRRVR